MRNQTSINADMRAVLVDWMVEVQETFELNHETLYLAVKMVDLYLGQVSIKKTLLQLVGATAMFIACKYDVSCILVEVNWLGFFSNRFAKYQRFLLMVYHGCVFTHKQRGIYKKTNQAYFLRIDPLPLQNMCLKFENHAYTLASHLGIVWNSTVHFFFGTPVSVLIRFLYGLQVKLKNSQIVVILQASDTAQITLRSLKTEQLISPSLIPVKKKNLIHAKIGSISVLKL